MEQIVHTPIQQIPTKKIYGIKSIWFASFLGGPLTAAYLFAENFKTFNEQEKVKKTWLYGIIALIILIILGFILPEKIARSLSVGYFAGVYSLTNQLQKKKN
jgi:H+/Cl- antiporter ClcA